MSTEHRDIIYTAESLRVAGQLQQVLELVRDSLVDPSIIQTMDDNLLSDHIRQWRIATVTGMSMTQSRWLAINAQDSLLEIRPVFTTYYHHPEVSTRSRNYLVDNEGHLYDHSAEMIRDEGKYYSIAFYISGNPLYLTQSAAAFERAIDQAALDEPQGIAMIELGQIKGLINSYYHKGPSSVYQTYIHPGFELALNPVIRSGNEDRIKWLVNNIMYEAQYYMRGNFVAKEDYQEAELHLKEIFGEKRSKDIQKEFKRLLLDRLLHKLIWNATRLGVNFSSLGL